jgi:hypothetical protein
MGGNRNKRGGRELSSAHPSGGGARPGMGTGRSYKLNLKHIYNFQNCDSYIIYHRHKPIDMTENGC